MFVSVVEIKLRVFSFMQRERVDPRLCASPALIPAEQRPVLKVTEGFVCGHGEGGAGYGVGVTIEQGCVVGEGAQYPADEVVEHSEEPEHQ